jgi:predicted DsbA family dithiol-disulfide isomerase
MVTLDIFSDPDTQRDIADGTWLDAAVIARLLASGADRDFARDSDARARAQGMTGVPTFIFGHRHVVMGAQPPEIWDRVIAESSGGEQTP